jgi:NAD(P)-dependent dehydrogenase (short-subunit alcohol dehydrogenase family)
MPGTVLITGASSGIGAACAQRFLAEDWSVAAVGRRREPLERLRGQAPERVLAIPADVTREADLAAIAAAVGGWRPRLQAVVQCAGDFLVRPMEATEPAEFERLWRLTVWAKFALVRALLPHLLPGAGAGAGRPTALVHLASLAAHRDFPDETAYMSAMHGVLGLARAQDAELRGRGIRAAVVSPGLVRTALTERSFPPEALAGALAPEAIAGSVWQLVQTIREGGYIAEIFHVPQNSA